MPRRALVLILLGVFIVADFAFIVLPTYRTIAPFTTARLTLVQRRYVSIRTPDVQVAAESTPPRLLYGDDATDARLRGEQNWQAIITWPFPTERGVFLPFYQTCRFSLTGWDDPDRLRGEFIAHFNADPTFAALPDWCRDAMTNPSGRATRIVWRAMLHDAILLGAIGAFITLSAFTTRRVMRRLLARRRKGRCRACGYDLSGITSPNCPECGEPIPRITR